MKYFLASAALFLVLLPACAGKKKEATQPTYVPPEVQWPDDEDLDDLPEAGEDTG